MEAPHSADCCPQSCQMTAGCLLPQELLVLGPVLLPHLDLLLLQEAGVLVAGQQGPPVVGALPGGHGVRPWAEEGGGCPAPGLALTA